MKILQFLLLYYLLKSQLLRLKSQLVNRLKIKPRLTLTRKDRQAMGLIANKIKETPQFSSLSEAEKTAFLMFGLVLAFGFIKSISKTSNSEGQNGLPPFFERLLSSFLKAEYAECLLGDLHEEYQERLKCLSEVSAKVWLYGQIFRSVWPLAREAAKDKLFSLLRHKL